MLRHADGAPHWKFHGILGCAKFFTYELLLIMPDDAGGDTRVTTDNLSKKLKDRLCDPEL